MEKFFFDGEHYVKIRKLGPAGKHSSTACETKVWGKDLKRATHVVEDTAPIGRTPYTETRHYSKGKLLGRISESKAKARSPYEILKYHRNKWDAWKSRIYHGDY